MEVKEIHHQHLQIKFAAPNIRINDQKNTIIIACISLRITTNVKFAH